MEIRGGAFHRKPHQPASDVAWNLVDKCLPYPWYQVRFRLIQLFDRLNVQGLKAVVDAPFGSTQPKTTQNDRSLLVPREVIVTGADMDFPFGNSPGICQRGNRYRGVWMVWQGGLIGRAVPLHAPGPIPRSAWPSAVWAGLADNQLTFISLGSF